MMPASQPSYPQQQLIMSAAPTVCALLGLPAPSGSEGAALQEVTAEMAPQKRAAIILLDALGISTWHSARERMPSFARLAEGQLLKLRSVLPCSTPVCFASIVTGARPEVHGVRQRTDEMKVESVFQVIRRAGKTSAVVGRRSSSTGLLLARYSDTAFVAVSNTDQEVEEKLLLAIEQEPAFIFIQLLDIDNAGHARGPASEESIGACERTDARMSRILSALSHNGYGAIVMADHGQHTVKEADGAIRGTHDGSTEEDMLVPLTWQVAAEPGGRRRAPALRGKARRQFMNNRG
jgi:predicted AlkP superfamily pyrophosphatase or phosphodiesterase